jgi:hypothetical protein
MTKIQLPLFVDTAPLPTGKCHISFSEQNVWSQCSYRHKLQYIDKLSPFEGSIHTSYGKAIHDAIEYFLLTKKMQTADEVRAYFYDLMKPLLEVMPEEEKAKVTLEMENFASNIEDTISQVPDFFNTQFPGWKVHSAEFNLFEKIDRQKTTYFKGFIDAIIMVPKKERKNAAKKTLRLSDFNSAVDSSKQEYEYWILDHKTCQFFWTADKRRDFKVQMQLILYKHYFCKKFDIPLKDVKLGFNLIRMRVGKTDKTRMQIVPISAGEKTIERALKEINYMVNSVRKKIFMKNRASCKYCPFYQTEHCK